MYFDALSYSWDTDYEIGYNINPYDIDELKGKIIMVLDDKLFPEEELVDISNHVKLKYSWEKSASTFMKLIEKVV